MLTTLKEKIQQMLTAEAMAATKLGLTPNILSGIGIALAILSAFAYWAWQLNTAYIIVATIFLLLSGFCDALDGILARLSNRATVFGGFLDSLLDRYADAFVYVGIIVAGLCDMLWGLLATISSLLVSYSRARAEAAGIKMESVGLAERAERIIVLAVASIFAYIWQPKTVMNAVTILLTALSTVTIAQRTLHVYTKSKKKENG